MLFSAQILFRAEYDPRSPSHGLPDEQLWEESIFLIEADSAEAAEQRAAEVGKAHEHAYLAGDEMLPLKWTFVSVEQVTEIIDVPLRHGSELFSRFWRQSELHVLRQSSDAEAYAESAVP